MSPNILASVNAFACPVPIKMATKVTFGAFCDRPMVADRLLEVLVLQTDLDPDEPDHFAAVRSAEGHRAFKLNTRLRHDFDLSNLSNLSNLTVDLAALPPYQSWLQA